MAAADATPEGLRQRVEMLTGELTNCHAGNNDLRSENARLTEQLKQWRRDEGIPE